MIYSVITPPPPAPADALLHESLSCIIVWSLISSSSTSLLTPPDDACDICELLEVDPLLGGNSVPVPPAPWLAGRMVTIRFDEFATIMSVTWSSDLPATWHSMNFASERANSECKIYDDWTARPRREECSKKAPSWESYAYMSRQVAEFSLNKLTSMPLTSKTSSFTARRPVDSASPPGTSRDMKMPGTFSKP